jgi:outer membrane translocation and assembly module TamA
MWFKNKYCLLYFMLFSLSLSCIAQHTLHVQYLSKDTAINLEALQIKNTFSDSIICINYIKELPTQLFSKGYPSASIDSVWGDSATTHINLFLGKKYVWLNLNTNAIEQTALAQSGFVEKNFISKPINFLQLQKVQEGILNYYENNGYPFAAVLIDSIQIQNEKVSAIIKASKGLLYHVDSFRIVGNANISKLFLQRYLNIPFNSLYDKSKILKINKKLAELNFLQQVRPHDITLLGNGAIINLYLANKRNSQVNAIVGFLPAANQNEKLQITGDVNFNLKNQLGKGETIVVNWQSLQKKSPRLNLAFQQSYLFNSPFGIDFALDFFKKDSSFVNLNVQLGVQYILSAYQSGKIFVQWQNSFLLASGIDTNQVKFTKKLPSNIDVKATNIGLDYEWIKTDYKLNPISGNELKINASVGLKNIKKNNAITGLKDALFNYASLYDSIKANSYQFRVKLFAAHYFPFGKQSALKTSVTTAIFASPNIFKNELFQIGGYRLLRGFNEESIYASKYIVGSVEYKYKLALNSYLFGFVDAGLVNNNYQTVKQKNIFLGTGIGLVFETAAGLLNISYALGKRDDVKFNIREASKIHFGYVNYF